MELKYPKMFVNDVVDKKYLCIILSPTSPMCELRWVNNSSDDALIHCQ